MKKYNSISIIAVLVLIVFSCKKEPELPAGSSKIEIVGTIEDTTSYNNSIVTSSVAKLEGNTISQHGHCWSIGDEPTIEDKHTSLGELESPKSFTSTLDSLEQNTKYNIRSYLNYSYGIIYGEQISITTLKTGVPVITTSEVSDITLTTAKCGGEVTVDSGLFIVTRGVCWDTLSSVDIEHNIDFTNNGDSLGLFTSNLTGLNEGKTYFVKAYATNEKGTSYGQVKEFSTTAIILPEVLTIDIKEVTINSAESGGNVISSGNGIVTTRGVCWNSTGSPTLQNSIGHTIDGSGTGNYLSIITNLTDGVTYYVTAYATNEKGTSYGEVKQFSTVLIYNPTVSTTEITNVTTNSAFGGGDVTSNGNGTVTVRGVCWNTTGNPTLENNLGFTTEGNGAGFFTSKITGLNDDATYFVTAYATNERGTGYGENKPFTTFVDACEGETSIIYEGQSYNIISIGGNQCWAKENLNYEAGNSWCYDDDTNNCELYGRLYDWYTAQTVCPSGWHLPTDDDWKILEANVDSVFGIEDTEWDNIGWRGYDVGKHLKTTTGWSIDNGTDAFGFSLLPGGYRTGPSGYEYLQIGNQGFLWTTTSKSSSDAWDRRVFNNEDRVFRYGYGKNAGFSVRCLKN